MLQAIIPGVREIRSPLAAGYLLAAAIWLLAYDRVVAIDDHGLDRASELFAVVERPGAVVAATFGIYLVGTQLVVLSDAILLYGTSPIETTRNPIRLWMNRRRIRLTWSTDLQPLYDRIADIGDELEARATRVGIEPAELDRLIMETRAPRRVPGLAQQLVVEAKSDTLDQRVLLLDAGVYNEVSRLRSEAELRAAVILPGALLALAVTIDAEWAIGLELLFLLLAGGFAIALAINAIRIRSRAQRILLRLVADGQINTPTIDAVERKISREDARIR